MTQMNQDDILSNTRSVVQSLEALKNEHSSMIKTLVDKLDTLKNDVNGRTILEEEISILKNSDDMVHLGISEANVLMQLSNYLQSIEAEKQKIKSQVKRLCQENAWLRDELAAAQKKLQESEQYSAQIEVELSHLKFLKELRKFDEDLNQQQQQQQQIQMINQDGEQQNENVNPNAQTNNKRLDLPYQDEEDEQSQNNCKFPFLLISQIQQKWANNYLAR